MSEEEETILKKRFTASRYQVEGYKCPVCGRFIGELKHGKPVDCPQCSVQLTRYGNSLECKLSFSDYKYFWKNK